MAESRLLAFARALLDARDFVGVATVICNQGKELFGVHQSLVMMFGTSGRPVIGVDNIAQGTDEYRIAYFTSIWVMDPFHRLLRASHQPVGEEHISARDVMAMARRVGYDGDYVYSLALPILEPAGLLGTMYCGLLTPFPDELRRELTAAATHVAVRLAQLGVTRPTESGNELARLTPRQLDVAQLTAMGRSNAEIASVLLLSENTIKKHLKDVFERVDVSSRAELATLLARSAPRECGPAGVTRTGDVKITRVDRPVSRTRATRASSAPDR